MMKEIATTSLKWLNSARVARCQLAQKPSIENPKTSNRAQRRCKPTTRISLSSVALKHNFLNKNYELVVSPYEATAILLWALRAQIMKHLKFITFRMINTLRGWYEKNDLFGS